MPNIKSDQLLKDTGLDGENLRITRIKAQNFMQFEFLDYNTDGDVITVSGKNGVGKTSIMMLVQSIFSKKDHPEDPIRFGEKTANASIEIAGGIITAELKWRKNKNPEIIFKAAGHKLGSPATLAKELFEGSGLKFMEFYKGSKKDRYNILADKMGLDLEDLRLKYKKVYTERTEDGASLRSLKAQLNDYVLPPNCATEEKDASEIIEKIKDANSHNDLVSKEKTKLENVRSEYDSLSKIIKSLKEELIDLEAKLSKIKETGKKQSDIVSKLSKIDTSDFEDQLKNLELINNQARRYKRKLEIESGINKDQEIWDRHTAKLEQIQAQQAKMIEDAPVILDGLALKDGEVYYNNLPLSQASDGEKIKIACCVAMHGKQPIKIIMVKDGSMIDDENKQIIFDAAKERGFQVVWESVTSDNEVSVSVR